MHDVYDALVVNVGIMQDVPVIEDTAWLTIEEAPCHVPSNELIDLIKGVLDNE